MALILGDEYIAPALTKPFPSGHHIWEHEPLALNPAGSSMLHRAGPGIPIPDAGQPFVLAEWAQYVLYHGHLGTSNQFVGIVMDYALHVSYWSIFGSQLG